MIRSGLRGGLDFPRIRKYPVRVEVCNISIWFTVCHKMWYRETYSTWCVRSLEIVRPLPKCVTRGTLAPFRHPRKRNGTSQNFKTILFTRKITPTESHSWEVPQANNPKTERNSPESTGTRYLYSSLSSCFSPRGVTLRFISTAARKRASTKSFSRLLTSFARGTKVSDFFLITTTKTTTTSVQTNCQWETPRKLPFYAPLYTHAPIHVKMILMLRRGSKIFLFFLLSLFGRRRRRRHGVRFSSSWRHVLFLLICRRTFFRFSLLVSSLCG